MPPFIKVSNTQRAAAKSYLKVDGTWRNVPQMWLKVSGSWRRMYNYQWGTGGWSACSGVPTCGCGTQTRSVYCYDTTTGQTAADSFCTQQGSTAGTKPATETSCNCQTCTYSWYAGSWGAYSHSAFVPANGCSSVYSSRSRTVYCRRSDGTQVSDSYCSGGKPISSEGYYNSCSWVYGAWSPNETAGCLYYQQTRTAVCTGSIFGDASQYLGEWAYIQSNWCGAKGVTVQYANTCSGCDFDESMTVCAKLKQLRASGDYSWTMTTLRSAMIQSNGSVQAWWNVYGVSESICPWVNIESWGYIGCCIQRGYTYYCNNYGV